jgi:hypothetical protein
VQTKKWLAGFRNPWFWVFAITTGLQVFRGSAKDTIIFSLCTLAVWISASGVLGNRFGNKIEVNRAWTFWGVVVFAIALTAIDRHGYIHGVLVLTVLPIVLRLAWYSDRGPKEKPDPRMARSRTLWTILCLAITAWEFMANILGQFAGSLKIYPTISVLIDPLLDTKYGQAGFVILWLAIGIGFLRIWGRK